MARKDQLSSKKDSCDICGTVLDDDAVIQEFPDGSVVRLCAECATAAPPEDELEDDDELEPGDRHRGVVRSATSTTAPRMPPALNLRTSLSTVSLSHAIAPAVAGSGSDLRLRRR